MDNNNEDKFQLFDPETGRINFDDVVKLHQENPEKLEELRKQLIKEVIDSTPEKHRKRLEGLQFEIDARRQLAENPLQSFMVLSEMFWERGFLKLQDALNGDLNSPEPNDQACDIIDFSPDRKTKH